MVPGLVYHRGPIRPVRPVRRRLARGDEDAEPLYKPAPTGDRWSTTDRRSAVVYRYWPANAGICPTSRRLAYRRPYSRQPSTRMPSMLAPDTFIHERYLI